MPRRADLGEHVNNHQIDFVRTVVERVGGIVPVFDVSELPTAIERARSLSKDGGGFKSHNAEFCRDFERLIERL